MKILLIDPVGAGHHQEYAVLLAGGLTELGLKIYFAGSLPLLNALASTSLIQDGIPLDEIKVGGNFFNNERMRVHYYQRSIAASRKFNVDICHFLYMDHLLISGSYSWILQSNLPSVCGTLHGVYFLPTYAVSNAHKYKGKADLMALRFLCSRGMRIMVHSKNLAIYLNELTGTQKVDYVPYPVKTYEQPDSKKGAMRARLRGELGLAPQAVLILVFGGTRYDKGADLAVKMLPYLPDHYHLLFAGKDTYFSRNYLTGLASKHGLLERLHFDSRFIPEEEVPALFSGCDIVLLPYRKNFSGQSGPLTVAAALGTKIVAPDLPVLAETISNDNLGWLYPVEDLERMAAAVLEAANAPALKSPQKFIDDHSALAFSKAVASSYSNWNL
jgi:glycosyltransferase involved in cell wall biosynthesis